MLFCSFPFSSSEDILRTLIFQSVFERNRAAPYAASISQGNKELKDGHLKQSQNWNCWVSIPNTSPKDYECL